MKKAKFVSILAILLVFVGLFGCGEDTTTADTGKSMPDFQYSFKRNSAEPPTQKSDMGYYNLLSGNIIFTDKSNLKSTPFCNKSNCLHNGQFPDCNAKIKDFALSFDNFQMYRDKLYYLANGEGDNDKGDKTLLKSITLDGGKGNTVFEFINKKITDCFLYDGYFYYQTSVTESEDGSVDSSGAFYRKDLDTGEEELFIDFSKVKGVYDAEGSMRNVYKGYMYVTLCGYKNAADYEKVISTDSIEGDIETELSIFRYSLKDGSCIKINPYNKEYELLGFANNALVGYSNDSKNPKEKTICTSDLDGKNPKEIMKLKADGRICCDDEYIYVFSGDMTSLSIYNMRGKLAFEKAIPVDIKDYLSDTPFYDEYIFFQTNEEALCCIEKSKLLSSSKEIEYENVYKYE